MKHNTQFWLKAAIILALNLCLLSVAVFAGRQAGSVSSDAVAALSQYGSQGDEVTKIQQRLKNWGYFDGPVTG